MLIALWREANERPEAFVDHAGVLRDARTGKAIEEAADEKEDEEMCKWCCAQSSLTPSRGPAGRRNRKMTLIPLQSADSASSMLVRLKRRLHRQRGGDRRSVSNQPTNQPTNQPIQWLGHCGHCHLGLKGLDCEAVLTGTGKTITMSEY
jgi:hypothetical protein